ncbi:Hypothetical Protein FCC1311_102902 [Hondaea fermentalgiana]|uniref:Uncharacterized protein n=1 Tax=Hondaea fermentalgiana TaxID=2315210 RepID=A0A2R5GT73_9STRA|nr:Hypothetical Protein FCC1311_102902 [Hondaea fermentalgiana]|eukprot:GBG34067.1 Hypothetical Protein FCC1311_102902 [Hondaea fermentalgiana]
MDVAEATGGFAEATGVRPEPGTQPRPAKRSPTAAARLNGMAPPSWRQSLARVWNERERLAAAGTETLRQAWNAAQEKEPRIKAAAQVCAVSGGVAVVLVAWLVLLTVLESTLIVLSGIVGLVLVVSSVLAPIAIVALVIVTACIGVGVTAFVARESLQMQTARSSHASKQAKYLD